MDIRDTWSAGERATEVSWQWLTQATAAIESDGFMLRAGGETSRLRATGSAALHFAVEDASAPRAIFDSPNPGLSRLVIRLQTPAHTAGELAVSAAIRARPMDQ